mmetsp:Transcript_28198/g.46746  ORF Transcript_28198/g.46746 Transcript_28198/m.46746 type:complete len:115 (-) Transcript_28198:253-597(-)
MATPSALPPVEITVMDPKPGERYVEYSKDGFDGDVKSSVDSGLDVENKPNLGSNIYLSKVTAPAPEHNLKIGDRLVALNGKKIESYGSLEAVRKELASKNVICMVIDPTMITRN